MVTSHMLEMEYGYILSFPARRHSPQVYELVLVATGDAISH